ncbi:MAG TPA: rRNA maturation RNase YbeY [Lacunisphaera sp.]|nr:rRNA maturation RNase YbeY [Lacunisphaera sp.]
MNREVVINNRHPRLVIPRGQAQQVIHTLEAGLPALRVPPAAIPPGELSLVFLTDPDLTRIHDDFMNDPTATDVITFEGNAAAGLAGEICVSADTAARYVGLAVAAASAGAATSTRRPSRALQERFATELTLYVVHGWLHLAGYDDLQPAKKRHMRAAEARAMRLLREADAVPEFRLE